MILINETRYLEYILTILYSDTATIALQENKQASFLQIEHTLVELKFPLQRVCDILFLTKAMPLSGI